MNDDLKAFKAAQFMQDLGLDFHLKMLYPKPTHPPVPNVITMVPKTQLMDCPRTATYKHIKNLIATYGIDIVLEAVDVATEG